MICLVKIGVLSFFGLNDTWTIKLPYMVGSLLLSKKTYINPMHFQHFPFFLLYSSLELYTLFLLSFPITYLYPENMSTSGWFYIRSTSTGNVVAASANTEQDLLRSQVIVTPPTLSDHELWCWKGQFLCNKANDLVLDIRKGRLRLIEDTEICLYSPKPLEDAHNQLWSVREDAVDAYGRPLPGSYIYSLCSNEWVLDVQPTDQGVQKLVLFPLQPIDNDNQRWIFVKEGQLDLNVSIRDSLSMVAKSSSNASYFSMSESLITPPGSVSSSPDYPTTANEEYPQGLTPAKRGSHSAIFSMEAFKDYYNRVYASQEANVRYTYISRIFSQAMY